MLVHFALALLIIMSAGACASQQPMRSVPASSAGPMEELLQLAEKTQSLGSFTATYAARVDGKETSTIRLIYLEPNRAKVESEFEGRALSMWMIDGVSVVRSDLGRTSTFAEVSMVGFFSESSSFASVMRSEFPTRGPQLSGIGAGPFFNLQLEPNEASPDHGSFLAGTGWHPRRRHLFSWLGRLEDWSDARREPGRLIRELAGGGTMALSLETGFIEEIEHPGGFELKLIELANSADESEFQIPESRDEARDVSEQIRGDLLRRLEFNERKTVYTAAIRSMDEEGGRPEELSGKLTRVFEALYRPIVSRHLGEWKEKTAVSIDAFAQVCEQRYRLFVNEPEHWKGVDDEVAQWKSKLEQHLAQGIDQWTGRIRPPEPNAGDPERLASIAQVEREVLRLVHGREIASPLLTRFDERFETLKQAE